MSHREQFATQALIADATMPKTKLTEEERRVHLLASYSKYNESHRGERREHNRIYSKLAHVKERRRELYRQKKEMSLVRATTPRSSGQTVDAQI